MYNRLNKHLSNLKILYPKQFSFQKGHSTDHALLQLVNQIYESFERNEYTIGDFIDLSKAFDTVDHNILLKTLEIYGISGMHLQWFRIYLSYRKQYNQIDGWQKTNYKTVKCGVPQGSILRPLRFLLYINNLPFASDLLDPIMFTDDKLILFKQWHKNLINANMEFPREDYLSRIIFSVPRINKSLTSLN